jgi:hypothetical protein
MMLTDKQRRLLEGLQARHAARLRYVARYGHCPVDASGQPLLGALPDLDALLALCAELGAGEGGSRRGAADTWTRRAACPGTGRGP